jgi:catechol-2,3-dioxygenase
MSNNAFIKSVRLQQKGLLPPLTQLVRGFSTATAPLVRRLNHVAIAVPNLEEAAAKYKDVLGVKVGYKNPPYQQGRLSADGQPLPACTT